MDRNRRLEDLLEKLFDEDDEGENDQGEDDEIVVIGLPKWPWHGLFWPCCSQNYSNYSSY